MLDFKYLLIFLSFMSCGRPDIRKHFENIIDKHNVKNANFVEKTLIDWLKEDLTKCVHFSKRLLINTVDEIDLKSLCWCFKTFFSIPSCALRFENTVIIKGNMTMTKQLDKESI